MNAKKTTAALLALVMSAGLAACGGQPAAEQTEEPAAATEQPAAVTEAPEASEAPEEEAFSFLVDNASIDAETYLNYAAGIEAGVYKWVLSEDGDYYTLAAVDEDGEPLTAEESAINVGANNAERGDMTGAFRGADGENGAAPEGGVAIGARAALVEGSTGETPTVFIPQMPGEDSVAPPQDAQEVEVSQNAQDAPAAQGAQEGQQMPAGGEGLPEGQGESGFGGFGGPGGMGGMMFGGGGTVYQGVYMNANVTNLSNQTMLIYVPAAYLTTDADGNVTGIDHDATVGAYTADTAPIVYLNECGGWKSSSPRSCDTSYIEQGMIYVTAGARSRDAVDEDGNITGKSPMQVVDLKSGVMALRANADVIPGDTDRIISIGTSGGGQMSSILGASGNMPEYYEYLYEAGALGVTKNADGSYESALPDNVYAAQLYCPIADIENADLAYAWWWVDLADAGGTYRGSMTDFERRLQELEAEAFVDYLNGLNLTDGEGNALTLTGLRSGSYYEAVLGNISDALNAMAEAGEIDPAEAYPDSSDWLTQNEDGSWSVTDMAGFMIGTGLVNNRNKAIPGFDTLDKSAENDAFGTSEQTAVHFSRSVAQILSDNYDELSALDGFDAEQVDNYIEEALTGADADAVAQQANLMNATEILLGSDGLSAVDPAEHWRDRSGTADQHTSFSIGYNICLAAEMLGLDADYHLVWNMGHGSAEGTTTGTFIDWINEICAE